MAVTVPMRVLIGVMVAIIVVIVAVVTLVITYSVALTSLRAIAEDYSVALAQRARADMENYVDGPSRDQDTIQEIVQTRPGFMLPANITGSDTSSGPGSDWCRPYIDMYLYAFISSNRTRDHISFLFDDGGGAVGIALDPPQSYDFIVLCQSARNEHLRSGFLSERFYQFNLRPGQRSEGWVARPSRFAPQKDKRHEGYFMGKSTNMFTGFWGQLLLWYTDRPVLMLPAAVNVRSAAGQYMGILGTYLNVLDTERFLKEIKTHPDTEAFALDVVGRIIGATHAEPYYTTSFQSIGLVRSGCVSETYTTEPSRIGKANYSVACLQRADESKYPPLRAAYQQNRALLQTNGIDVDLIDTGDGKYYVVSANVRSRFAVFKVNILFFMPEELVIGDIVSGRNKAIGATVGLVVLASIVSFLLVFALLRPLLKVSRQMHDTARLKDTDSQEGEPQFSNLTEVRLLQKSYYNMNSAIQSFTRYVPKDVVTDLMQSGQLCEIKMDNMKCSILFTDIQGFTTICERVPAAALSPLISQYFDVMSNIVMDHDGLIDKFIGDCIMAVWGAPFPLGNHEVKCTLAGLLLNRETIVDPLQGAFDEVGEVLGIRVGINTGDVLAGNMGSSQRMNYTVIGDPVNLAARLESMNKQFGSRVMVSEDTAGALGRIFHLRLLLSIAVVGKALPVKVYDVVGLQQNLNDLDRTRLKENDERATKDFDSKSESDGVSWASVLSTATEVHKARKDPVGLITIAMQECAQTETPIVPSDGDVQFAQDMTEAVNTYLRKDFKGAVERLDKIFNTYAEDMIGAKTKVVATTVVEKPAAETPQQQQPSIVPAGPPRASNLRKNVIAERSIQILEDLCNEALADPSAFVGYFAASEK